MSGAYAGDTTDERATFDLQTTFAGCHEVTGTLDGSLQWTSAATGTSFTASITGDLDWKGNNGDASCEFDLSTTVATTGVSWGGHLCGYTVGGEVVLGI